MQSSSVRPVQTEGGVEQTKSEVGAPVATTAASRKHGRPRKHIGRPYARRPRGVGVGARGNEQQQPSSSSYTSKGASSMRVNVQIFALFL